MAKKLAAVESGEPVAAAPVGGNWLMPAVLIGQALMFAAMLGVVLFVLLRQPVAPGPVPATPSGITAMLKSQPAAALRFAGLHDAAATFVEIADGPIDSTDDLVRFNEITGQFIRATMPEYKPVPGLNEAWAEQLRRALGGSLEPQPMTPALRSSVAKAYRDIAAAEREAGK